MKKETIAFIFILAIVVGCEKNFLDTNSKFNLSASIENAGTKATLTYGGSTSDNFLTWETGDKILLLNSSSRVEATLTSGTGTRNGTFISPSLPSGDYFAVYPASEHNFINNENDDIYSDTLFVYYPNQLTYNPETGNVENGGNVMIACQSGTNISFYNICSYLRLTITGTESQKVSKVVLESKSDQEYLAGHIYLNLDEQNLSEYLENETDFYFYKNRPCYKSVDINFPEGGVALSETGLSFNVAVAPICNGFKATVYLTDNSYQELSSKETWWGRNELIVMPAFEFTADK